MKLRILEYSFWFRCRRISQGGGFGTTIFPCTIIASRYLRIKRAALIDFTGYAGYEQTEPVVLDDLEEEDEETNVIGDACDEECVVDQPTLFCFETGGSSKGHNV